MTNHPAGTGIGAAGPVDGCLAHESRPAPESQRAPGSPAAARPRIVVLGSINMDLIATTATLPAPGQTVLGTSFATAAGGKGSNQAIAAARAGAAATFIGSVGADSFADELSATLSQAGVSTELLRRVGGPSGIALITVDAAAENTIVVVPGANATVTDLSEADRVAISTASILLAQLEIPLDTVTAGAIVAASAGVPVLLNPSPARELPAELLRSVTVLVVNEGEARVLGGDAVAAVPHVVTTLGAHGARYRGPDGRVLSVAAPRVDAMDTTGAGDAFTGALAVAWAEGASPEAALRQACAAGALATTKSGASTSSPTRAAIDALVAASYPADPSRGSTDAL